ncbi:MAG: formate dehydrogenase subunit gamma [Acuticoccus sp.]
MQSDAADIGAIIAAHTDQDGPLLPILHDVQAAFGCVDEAAERTIAHALNLTRAEVHGVVSFYHDFTATPRAARVIKLCRAEACQARGVEKLVPAAERLAEGRAAIETVYCLGLCAIGPAAMVEDRVVARLDEARLATLIAEG